MTFKFIDIDSDTNCTIEMFARHFHHNRIYQSQSTEIIKWPNCPMSIGIQ